MGVVKNGFKKGELIQTECGFPAFVYETQMDLGYISIFAFGLEAEHGSEYPEKAVRISRDRFWELCKVYGHSVEDVLKDAKTFKLRLDMGEA